MVRARASTSAKLTADEPPAPPVQRPFDGGIDALPWLVAPLAQALRTQRGHALLVHADAGVGALAFALAFAQGQLCEADGAANGRPCGRCGSCHLAGAGTHPDLLLRLPEDVAVEHQLAAPPGDKRKPSRQIRVEEMRAAMTWMTTTSGRGQGKVLVIHPAEAMNLVSASALLKTLEEPPSGARLVLTASDPSHLLPTVVSRCQRLRLPTPPRETALQWLQQHGVPEPGVLLDGAGGRPLEALRWHRQGVSAADWAALPRDLAAGDLQRLSAWPVARWLDALHKLCHDASVRACGGAARFYPEVSFDGVGRLSALIGWQRSLQRVARHADHPWNEPLLLEALCAEGREALRAKGSARADRAVATLSAR
jgi:DNA polymerase-3 subunit delta'